MTGGGNANDDHHPVDLQRFNECERVYLETSAFNFLIENVGLDKFELTRAYQRKKGVIFVTSPVLLWEIMLNTDRQDADMMLMAAQALFDPILLGTPSELATRYLRSAYPRNVINYDVRSRLDWAGLWARMTRDFSVTMDYDFQVLLSKSKPLRDISKNLTNVIEGISRPANQTVDLARIFVTETFDALRDDLNGWGVDDVTAKFVILYAFLLLLAYADLDGSAARDFWLEKGFVGNRERAEVTEIFIEYPEIFLRGPILEMAIMAALQYRTGKTNRGAILDGMHMAYAPYVSAILSNDAAFLNHANSQPHYHSRVYHMSQIQITDVGLDLTEYPHDQKLRF